MADILSQDEIEALLETMGGPSPELVTGLLSLPGANDVLAAAGETDRRAEKGDAYVPPTAVMAALLALRGAQEALEGAQEEALEQVVDEAAEAGAEEEELKRAVGEAADRALQEEAQPEPVVTSYDFKHPARVNKDQLRTLENLHDNFARLLSSTFSGAMRSVVDVDTAFVDRSRSRV